MLTPQNLKRAVLNDSCTAHQQTAEKKRVGCNRPGRHLQEGAEQLQQLGQGHEGRPVPDQQQGVGGQRAQDPGLQAGPLKLQGSRVEGVQAPLEPQADVERGVVQLGQVLSNRSLLLDEDGTRFQTTP